MIRVRKIAHAGFETPDLDRQVAYYTDILGLALVATDKDAAYLASTLDHHSVVLRRGAEARCTRIAFQLAPDADLDAFERQVAAHGVKTTRKKDPEPSIPELVSFEDPKGTIMEVFREHAFSGQAYQGKGIVPHKLGHVAFHVADVKKIAKFYCDVLGFRDSDWMADFFAFLRCGPDHHTINLVDTGKVKMHHIAFEVRDWAHIQTACDFLSLNGYKLIWGPGRHGIGHNLFAYHRNPDGQIVELFAELDKMPDEELGYFEPRPWHRDRPQKPKVWAKDPSASNLWGILPPEEMMR
jgi:catechol 2,3-dioxygenase-like lactoylglutathione lyase family enzyme